MQREDAVSLHSSATLTSASGVIPESTTTTFACKHDSHSQTNFDTERHSFSFSQSETRKIECEIRLDNQTNVNALKEGAKTAEIVDVSEPVKSSLNDTEHLVTNISEISVPQVAELVEKIHEKVDTEISEQESINICDKENVYAKKAENVKSPTASVCPITNLTNKQKIDNVVVAVATEKKENVSSPIADPIVAPIKETNTPDKKEAPGKNDAEALSKKGTHHDQAKVQSPSKHAIYTKQMTASEGLDASKAAKKKKGLKLKYLLEDSTIVDTLHHKACPVNFSSPYTLKFLSTRVYFGM
jgi:hypothetical protein